LKDLSLLLNHGKVISPTGTVKGTPLTVLFSGRALALIRCGSVCDYHYLTGVPDKVRPPTDTNTNLQGSSKQTWII